MIMSNAPRVIMLHVLPQLSLLLRAVSGGSRLYPFMSTMPIAL